MIRQTTIAICIATYRRRTLLTRLLHGIGQLHHPDNCTLEVRIVENEAAGSCQALVSGWAMVNPTLRVRYAVQPQQNIAMTRNAALEMGPADYYAFLDDDETPEPDWLLELLTELQCGQFDAVFGNVLAELPDNAPTWLTQGRYLSKLVHHQLGTQRWQATRTANALVRGPWLHELHFDPEFGTSGGEDTQLFRRMVEQGARLGWAPKARVHEAVQPEQCTLRWLFRRYRRAGLVYEQIARKPWPRLRAARRMAWACGALCLGLPAMLIGSHQLALSGCLRLASALGGLDHLAGTSHRSFVAYNSAGCEQ